MQSSNILYIPHSLLEWLYSFPPVECWEQQCGCPLVLIYQHWPSHLPGGEIGNRLKCCSTITISRAIESLSVLNSNHPQMVYFAIFFTL